MLVLVAVNAEPWFVQLLRSFEICIGVIRCKREAGERRLDGFNQVHPQSEKTGFVSIQLLDFGSREGTAVKANVVNEAVHNIDYSALDLI